VTATTKIRPTANSVLIVTDVQNCFLPGGTLAVPKGDEIVPLVNDLARRFENVVITQDWHPRGHASFASHHGKKPFETTQLHYGEQVLWPDHAVQGTEDAALHRDLDIPHAQLVIRKGYHEGVDSYSVFYEADHRTVTGMTGYLKGRGIDRAFLCGLATDYCVGWSAIDARHDGFETYVIEDACRAIDLQGSLAKAWADMTRAGVKRIRSNDIAT
jgi:nicotinamidase/pyrazinamidase